MLQFRKLHIFYNIERGGEEKGYCSKTLTRVVQSSVIKLNAVQCGGGRDIF